VGAAPAAAGSGLDAVGQRRLREAAEAFEALLFRSMLRTMREAQLEHGFLGEGTGTTTYEAMFEDHLSQSLAAGSPLGIADLLEARWLAQMGVQVTGDTADESHVGGTPGLARAGMEDHENR
jgi:Rod binding domain-containing protein